uniref:Protein ALP1-like n=1 Tax=Tanacetum cinerariifolium TaxID=118510 RepID=A0A6L2NQM5_TANCI|nr:protein ALP1-like [Tanacetum cinerariifolium]
MLERMIWLNRLTKELDVIGVSQIKMDISSAHDGRMLRDAISRDDGIKNPQGCYYLVNVGYCNARGFLTPFEESKIDDNGILDVPSLDLRTWRAMDDQDQWLGRQSKNEGL